MASTMVGYLRELARQSEYLAPIWTSVERNLLEFWHSELLKEFSKPDRLMAFGMAALFGALVPIVGMLGWRLFKRTDAAKRSYYEEIDKKAGGSFNTKVLSSITANRKTGKSKDDADSEEFDPIVDRASVEIPDDDTGDNPPPLEDAAKSSTSKKLNNIDENEENDDAEENEQSFEEKIRNPRGPVNATRITPDFKLNEKDMEELAHMEFHGKLKSATLRAKTEKIESSMTDEEREQERRLKQEQLESIFKLMQNESSKFGITDKEQLYDQFRLYSP